MVYYKWVVAWPSYKYCGAPENSLSPPLFCAQLSFPHKASSLSKHKTGQRPPSRHRCYNSRVPTRNARFFFPPSFPIFKPHNQKPRGARFTPSLITPSTPSLLSCSHSPVFHALAQRPLSLTLCPVHSSCLYRYLFIYLFILFVCVCVCIYIYILFIYLFLHILKTFPTTIPQPKSVPIKYLLFSVKADFFSK